MPPRVLIVLDTAAAWSRGILKGFANFAHEADWTILHYHTDADLGWLVREWRPDALVLAPGSLAELPAAATGLPLVVVAGDASADGIASVLPDDERISALALRHLLEIGLRQVTVFRFADSPFAVLRERSFLERAESMNVSILPVWWKEGAEPARSSELSSELSAWLHELPKPCGVFTCCDPWSRVIARYCRAARVQVPDDLALIGADNDLMECELVTPALSSVSVPWRALGREAACLIQQALAGRSIAGNRVVVPPLDVVSRRSTEVLAIGDPLVSAAVVWIRQNAARSMDVPAIVAAVSTSRQRLERRFHAVLGRTILQEVRSTRVRLAKQLLATTSLAIPEVAKKSGFTNAALMSVAFAREVGEPPSAYRRRLRDLQLDED